MALARILTKRYSAVYQCPKLFGAIFLDGLLGMCSDQHGSRGTTRAQEHLIRLSNIITGNWQMEAGESPQMLRPIIDIIMATRHYLTVSRFPRFWHDARIALNTDRGI